MSNSTELLCLKYSGLRKTVETQLELQWSRLKLGASKIQVWRITGTICLPRPFQYGAIYITTAYLPCTCLCFSDVKCWNALEWYSSLTAIELLWLGCQLRLTVNEEVALKKTAWWNNITCRIKKCRCWCRGYELQYYNIKIYAIHILLFNIHSILLHFNFFWSTKPSIFSAWKSDQISNL
jgi:hypothetical protein